MTINDDKTVAAVAAPVTSKEVKEKIKRSKKQKQPIFECRTNNYHILNEYLQLILSHQLNCHQGDL